MSPKFDVKQIKSNNPIERVVSKYVDLKPRGSHLFGLCPFHQEKTPSFCVVPGKQLFKCFGCGVGGDILDFLMKIENKSFTEVLEKLSNNHSWLALIAPPKTTKKVLPPDIIPIKYVRHAQKCMYQNYFIVNLVRLFGLDIALLLQKIFAIGTKPENNGTIFFYEDQLGNYRSGKIMYYHPQTGKRFRQGPKANYSWVHAELLKQKKVKSFNYVGCFFGEFQLRFFPKKPVMIVESEKTAIYMTVLMPEYIWLATGGSSSLRNKAIGTLKDRVVVLCPDAQNLESWRELASCIEAEEVHTSEWVSNVFQEKVEGLLQKGMDPDTASKQVKQIYGDDLADFLIQTNQQGQALNEAGIPYCEDIQAYQDLEKMCQSIRSNYP